MRSSLHRKLLMSSGGHLKGMLGQFFFFSSFVWRIGATIKYCLAQLRYKSLWRSGYGRRQTKDTFIINLFITNFKISAPLFFKFDIIAVLCFTFRLLFIFLLLHVFCLFYFPESLNPMDLSNNTDRTCAYYMQTKKRCCRMSVKVGRKFCGEHAALETADATADAATNSAYERIACPYDPKQ